MLEQFKCVKNESHCTIIHKQILKLQKSCSHELLPRFLCFSTSYLSYSNININECGREYYFGFHSFKGPQLF